MIQKYSTPQFKKP